ncbi:MULTISPECIES: heavy-metal-associated domain-containing protein [Brevibacterium]|uniref:Heavy metal transporter n=1 Tax=Brevibacterium aurantiacum TaxID=273384 RepID=A0A2A3ZM07_BREAU|nr:MULTISPECIES: cation transporter [Brevibacterium]MDN5551235.1 cation transporter [Brevibacterium sp.]PCC52710.1 heavy metal transporter [Brevibacterium aurantiacum]WCE40692.1 cation transporter [Brevibacterium sp. BDJS002]
MAQTIEFKVSGMTCGHCEMSVREEVQEIPGVTEVDVSHESGTLVITSEMGIAPEAVINAVKEAGYQAEPA